MKNLRTSVLVIVLFVAALTAVSVLAQEPSLPSTAAGVAPSPEAAAGAVQGFVDALAGKYGWITKVLIVFGSLRVLCKPVMTIIENSVASDPAKAQKLAAFEAGPVFKWISFALDLGASIKLPVIKTAVTQAK